MKRPNYRILMLFIFSLALLGTVAIAWYQREQTRIIFSDAMSIYSPIEAVTPRDVLWQPAQLMKGVLNTEGNDFEPSISRDGLVMFFVRGQAAHNADIYVAQRTAEGWSEPVPLDGVNSEADELGPELAPDGSALYFYSNRAGGLGGYDLWVARRDADGFAKPVNLGETVNSASHDYGPCLSPDGRSLLFSSDRSTPDDAEPDYDLYVSKIDGETYSTPLAVTALNSRSNEGAPAFSPVGDFLYFASDKPGGAGGFDLYRSRWLEGEFLEPENLGEAINTPAHEIDPAPALGGFGLYFSSDRPPEAKGVNDDFEAVTSASGGGGGGGYDLYYAESREVFAETTHFQAKIDWDALLALILPYAIWLGIVGVLLAILSKLLHSMEYNRMNLLTRCMVGSLMAHVLLLALLMVWGVSNSISNASDAATSTRVVLYSPSVSGGIAEQILGEMTDVQVDATMEQSTPADLENELLEIETSDAEFEVSGSEIADSEASDLIPELREAQHDPLATEDPQPVDEPDALQPFETEIPEQAQRDRSDEAMVSVPEEAVAEPQVVQAEDQTLPEVPLEPAVALEVMRTEVIDAQTQESMAEKNPTEDVEQIDSNSLIQDVSETRIDQSDIAEVDIPIVPDSVTERVVESQRTVQAQESIIARQDTTGEVQREEIDQPYTQITPEKTNKELPRESFVTSRTSESQIDLRTMPPLTSEEVPEQADTGNLKLDEMPKTNQEHYQEAQTQVKPTAITTVRTETSDSLAPAEFEARQVQMQPESSKLESATALVTKVPTDDAQTNSEITLDIDTHSQPLDDAPLQVALNVPAQAVLENANRSEARGDLVITPAESAKGTVARGGLRLESSASEFASNPDKIQLDNVESSLADTNEREAQTIATNLQSATVPSHIRSMTATSLNPDLPREKGEASGESEIVMDTLATTGEFSSVQAPARPNTAMKTGDVQVQLPTEASPLEVQGRSLAAPGIRDLEPGTKAVPEDTFSKRPAVEVSQATGLSLQLPTERDMEAGRARRGIDTQLEPLMAALTIKTHRSQEVTEMQSGVDAQVQLDPEAPSIQVESQQFTTKVSVDRVLHNSPDLNTSTRLPISDLLAPALNLPMAMEDGGEQLADAGPAQPLVAERASGRKREVLQGNIKPKAAAAVVMMEPTRLQGESNEQSLASTLLASASGLSADKGLPPKATRLSDGLAMPNLPGLTLPGMEEVSSDVSATAHPETGAASPQLAKAQLEPRLLELPDAVELERVNMPLELPPAVALTESEIMFSEELADTDALAPIENDADLPRLDVEKLSATGLFDLDLKLPLEMDIPLNPYQQRAPEMREKLVEIMGGSEETEQAVQRSLEWLARHQSRNGRWDGDHYDDDCGFCDGPAKVQVDIGLTGLSLLCFLAADHTHLKEGEYQRTVERGINWLLSRQRRDGSMLSNESMYSHGIATIALAEAYGMTGDPDLAEPVQRAINFIYSARNRGVGGWRYGPGQIGDTSVLGWQVMAMKSARRAGLNVPDDAFRVADNWVNLVSQSAPIGQYRYQPDGEITQAMCAEGMFVRQLLGANREDTNMQASAAYIVENLPDWDAECNVYYWYYATLALYQHQGDAWQQWNEHVKEMLLDHQHVSGRMSGSWDPEGRWAKIGGRVYQTALSTLVLEVYYRYLPTFVGDETIPPRNSIRGTVTNAVTGEFLPGAVIRLDLSEGRTVKVSSNERGKYTLLVPDVPNFVAISVSRTGYTPQSINVAAKDVRGQSLTRNFVLSPIQRDVIAMELEPRVHHLGNDEFTGKINSQFQKKSEGLVYETSFVMLKMQLPPADDDVAIRMLVRGAQARNEIRINSNLLKQRMRLSPRDGSFGEFTASFPASWLHEGENTLVIRSVRGANDLDDFEFVNIQIVLDPDS